MLDENGMTNGWKRAADMKHARAGHQTVAVDGKIYIFGGSDGSYVVEIEIWKSNRTLPLTHKSYRVAAVLIHEHENF